MQSFESIYSYHDVYRLSYFWNNPNHAAAVLVAVLPYFWVARCHVDPKGWKVGAYLLIALAELFWSFLIGWTFSRGAMVAWAVALGVLGVARGNGWRERQTNTAVFWCVSLVLHFSVLLGTSTGSRFADIAEGDRSALNRLGIWSNALQLIHAAPATGWGSGESDKALVQWFEPVLSKNDHAMVVGTYLHFGAEFGLAALGGAFFAIVFTLLIGRESVEKTYGYRRAVQLGALMGFCAFLVAAFFSTLWFEMRTIWVMVFYFIMILGLAVKTVTRVWRKMIAASAMAGCVSLIVYGMGWWLSERAPFSIKKFADGVTLHNNTNPTAKQDVRMVVDGLVLGNCYGKTIRQMMAIAPSWCEVVVYTKIPEKMEKGGVFVVFGPRYTEVSAAMLAESVLVCPIGPLPKFTMGLPEKLVLPEYDEFGYAPEWNKTFASEARPIVVLDGVGQDCSSKVMQLVEQMTVKK